MPDAKYPSMWRVLWPDGSQSDMVNLSRAKDAAMARCERGPPERNRRMFAWDTGYVETRSWAVSCASGRRDPTWTASSPSGASIAVPAKNLLRSAAQCATPVSPSSGGCIAVCRWRRAI